MTDAIEAPRLPAMNGFAPSCVAAWERCYRWYHELLPVGPLLLVGRACYRGPPRSFPDATCLAPGDAIGILHFNNAGVAQIAGANTRHDIAWQFTRLLRQSLQELAVWNQHGFDGPLPLFHGTTWMRAHGLRAGFVTEPLPEGWRTRLLRWQFAILRACFAPAQFSRATRIEPRAFWITRSRLRSSFLPPPTTYDGEAP